MLRLEHIVKNYQTGKTTFPALKGISLAFRKNEFVSILGPSGCGKTTLLNIIGGLDKYTSGDLVIEGRSTKNYKDHDWDVYRNHRIGFIFQSYNLIPHQNICENVELALTISGYSKEEKRKKALAALAKVGLKKSWKKMPNQLSGGQCQRVAIARALVNEPDILLGDEPTGALDSKTSVQVMELIKKISKKTLVIMVTHNPPLAEKYSTRIISLLDGVVKNDTNPYKLEEEKKEKYKTFDAVKVGKDGTVKPDKAKMSFWSSFKLSAKNLISKRKRTAMVIAASSIGIVGVSAVLAVSTGVKGYIKNTEKDMLSGNPLYVGETQMDLVSILQNVSNTLQRQAISESIKQTGQIDIEFITGALITQAKEGILIRNDINENYVKFVNYGKDVLGEYETGIAETFVDYGFTAADNIYTDAEIFEQDPEVVPIEQQQKYIYSLSGLKNIYTGLLDTIDTEDGTDFTALANIAANFPSVVYQGLDNVQYLQEQYDLVSSTKPGSVFTSRWPKQIKEEEAGTEGHDYECVIVLNRRKKLADLIVALSGLLSEEQFMKCINEFLKKEPDQSVIDEIAKIAVSKIANKSFYYIPNGKIGHEGAFKANKPDGTNYDKLKPFNYNYKFKVNNNETFTSEQDDGTTISVGADSDVTTAKRIKVVGIITPKEGRNYGSLNSGIYFQSDLANKIMKDAGSTETVDDEKNSEIYNVMVDSKRWLGGSEPNDPIYCLSYKGFANDIRIDATKEEGAAGKILPGSRGLYYPLNFYKVFYDGAQRKTKPVQTYGTVGSSASISKIPDETGKKTAELEITSSLTTRSISGRKLVISSDKNDAKVKYRQIPYRISVYSRDFDTKTKAKAYLDKWNQKGDVRIGTQPGDIVPENQRSKVTVPDNLTIVIAMINGIITTTTISLTIFASLSLVVSSVMIGIITYISVMERIKEIGVIRSLGGRKKDVSHLFNAETFIIGTASGLFGVVITYILELILDVSIYAAYKIPMIANLKWWTALLMIILSIVLTAISGLIPARSAANKDPVVALRSE